MCVTDFLLSVLSRNGLRNVNYLRTVGLRLVGDGRSRLGRREMRGRGNARRRESIGRRRGLRLNIIGGDMIVIMIDRGNGSIGIIGRGSIGRRTVRGIGTARRRSREIAPPREAAACDQLPMLSSVRISAGTVYDSCRHNTLHNL